MDRWGERQSVYAKSSNPKMNLHLTFPDKNDRGGKVVLGEPIRHQENPPRDTQGSWHFAGIHMKGIGP